MSEFLSRIKARLETGQHLNFASSEESGWVRAAVVGTDKNKEQEEPQLGPQSAETASEPANGSQTNLAEKMKVVGFGTHGARESPVSSASSGDRHDLGSASPQAASQRLWETGGLESKIPDGFYSVVPIKSLKARFKKIPSFDELKLLGEDRSLEDALLVDAREDKILSRLRELVLSSVKSIGTNPPFSIKKIADMVADFYGGPLFEAGVFKHPMDETSASSPQFLGEIKVGLCRPRALLFKFLSDAVGLNSRLLMGLQLEDVSSSSIICANPEKHLSNIVCLNEVELLVDVMRHPGHLRPFTRKSLIMYHISGAGDSDSADYDSCDSPLEPNSPLFGCPDRSEAESLDHELSDSPGTPLPRGKSSPVSAVPIQSVILRLPVGLERKLSPSQSEPDLANPYRRRSRRKAIADDQAAAFSPERPLGFQLPIRRTSTDGGRSFPSSSPEHPAFRVRAPSMLGGSRRHGGEEGGISSPEKSPQHLSAAGKNSPIFRRRRERSLSIDIQRDGLGVDFFRVAGESDFPRISQSPEIRKSRRKTGAPEIGDDVVRAVRAMNEAIKLERTRSKVLLDRQNKDATVQNRPESAEEAPKNASDAEVLSDPSSEQQLGNGFDQAGSLDKRNRSSQEPQSLESPFDITTEAKPTLDNRDQQPVRSSFDGNETSASEDCASSKASLATESNSPEVSSIAKTENHAVILKPPPWLQSPLMPFPEWNIDFKELRIGVRVGIGAFGEVFRGVWRGTEVAIKVMLEQNLTEESTADFCTEIALLSRLRHPNVVLFMGACTTPPLSMVTEYMHMGSLYSLVHTTGQGKKLSWQRRLKMLRDICRGMMSVQRMNIVHCDLKSANCLVDKHWCVKISDFGLSRLASGAPVPQSMPAAGTPEWMAPELLRNEPVTDKCDIFSLGIIMWELCTLKRPWEGVKPMQVVMAVAHKQARLEIPEGLLGKLIADCWAENPAARPTYEEILTRLHECEFLQI